MNDILVINTEMGSEGHGALHNHLLGLQFHKHDLFHDNIYTLRRCV